MRLRFWRRRKRLAFTDDVSRSRVVDGLVQHSRNPGVREPLRSALMVAGEERARAELRARQRGQEASEALRLHEACRQSLANMRQEREEVEAALVRLDRAAEKVLVASLVDPGRILSACHALDETRGAIWARYDAASLALKKADPAHPAQ